MVGDKTIENLTIALRIKELRDLTTIENILYFFWILTPDVIVIDFYGGETPKMYCK